MQECLIRGGAVIDDMPKGCSIQEIERMFTSVGFASPPNWLRPYLVLSNGEKMRCDLAYALLDGKDIVVYDEFTSVVNRQVAKAASFAISKCVRRNGKKFVAVSCHDDIVEWLQPDWIYNTDTRSFFGMGAASTNAPQSRLTFTRLGQQMQSGKIGRYSASITI